MTNVVFQGFSQDNMNMYLNELAKDIKKTLGRHAQVELILVGGAALFANGHSFRASTMDIDALESYGQSIKDAVRRTGERLSLPDDWLNSDFAKTSSYSHALKQYSKPYKTFCQVLSVRTIGDEYFIAMKLAASRQYKHDLSDIVGVVQHMDKQGITDIENRIKIAFENLYGDWEKLSDNSISTLKIIIDNKAVPNLYEILSEYEKKNKTLLQDFEQNYENVLRENNLDSILQSLRGKEFEQPSKSLDAVLEDAIHRAKEYNDNQPETSSKEHSDIEK